MKKFTSFILVLTMALSLTSVFADVDYGKELENQPQKTYEMTFTDVPDGYWAHDYIAEMVARGVIKGYPDGKFRPELFVSREEFAKIMTLAAGLTPAVPDWDLYSDVNRWEWSAPYIYAANAYLTGYYYGEDKLQEFRPTAPALREDIAVALVKLKAYDVSVADVGMIKDMFSDFNTISPRLQSYVAVAVSKGLVSGYEDGTFKAQDTVTRAEAATLLWRAYQYGSGNKIANPGVAIEDPQATQTPTPTQAPTVQPTQPPVVEETPKPTVEPTQEPVVEKEWKIDTLVSGVKNVKDLVYVGDTVYYTDGETISMAKKGGSASIICNIDKDLQPPKESKADGDRDLEFIGFAQDNGKAYVVIDDQYWSIYEINGATLDLVRTSYISICKNGLVVSKGNIYGQYGGNIYPIDTTADIKKIIDKTASGLVIDEIQKQSLNPYPHNKVANITFFSNNNIYGIDRDIGLMKYNYSIGDFDNIDCDKPLMQASWDYYYDNNVLEYYNNHLYFPYENKFYRATLNGDSEVLIDPVDVEVADMKAFSLNMFSVSNEDNIAVYSNDAIRLITRNK